MQSSTRAGSRGPARRADSRADSRGPGRRTAGRHGRHRRGETAPHDWFAQQLLLILSGQRPVHILLGHAGAQAYEQLSLLAPRAPLRPPPGGRAPVVSRVGASSPRTDAIEAFARIAAGDRTRALAFRLERRPGTARWQCCAVELDTVP
ncbi:Rv3235 family protein [Streptomyces sp. SBT349]|uniref:Rv3235 family protein n=1 Tax=Streptomyces sp. SBT349 TaxID=1580539 RepID=UPI00066ACFE0|nr:Rv3235 family protein [Streptomyces sp. SBT349]